jgi:phosphoribosylformimino-5-aminoimidazole carboxamide ribotide isomerase
VDLDAATGRGSNASIVEKIIGNFDGTVQVGGGVRTTEQVVRLLSIGATRIVVGTRALEERQWLEEISTASPGKIVVAMDVRGESVLTHGWQRVRPGDLTVEVAALDDLPLAGLLVTAVHREGRMQGPDVSLIAKVATLSCFPVQASGGIASAADLHDLMVAGASAAIVGMALYTGALSTNQINQVFTA